MSTKESDPKDSRRRSLVFLLTFGLGIGLALLVVTCAGQTPAVNAERASAPLVLWQVAELEAGKEGPDSTYAPGVVTYTIRITNNHTAQINNAVVTDTWVAKEGGSFILPAGFNGNYWANPTFVNAFTYTLPTEDHKTGVARWDLEPLPIGFQGTIEFTMSVPPEYQPFERSIVAGGDVGPTILGNSVIIAAPGVSSSAPDQVDTAVVGPVLKLTKSAATEPGVGPRPGRLITYSLRLENLTRQDSVSARGIVVWEILPEPLIYEDAWGEVPGTSAGFNPGNRHITWTLPAAFTLIPGEVTTVTFATRLPVDQEPDTIRNNRAMCGAISDEMVLPISCYSNLSVRTLGIVEKTYQVAPGSPDDDESYPNRYITYTVQVFNPLSQQVAHNLRVTDVMPSTWSFVEMVDGPLPESVAGDTVAWSWPSPLPANGVIEFSFVAHIGADTSVQERTCRKTYYNSMEASADEFPIVYQYGSAFGLPDFLAPVVVRQQVQLSKSVVPSAQAAGQVVTYTADLYNSGDRAVNDITFTDTLPLFFRYDSMVEGPPPTSVVDNTVVWTIATIEPDERYYLTFRATVDGEWGTQYANYIDAYSPETSFCAGDTAQVTVLSPIQYNKEAVPPLDSNEWVVQGEWFEYDVEFTNMSRIFAYEFDEFADWLYAGFEVNSSQLYTYELDPPFTLQTEAQNSWLHTFQVDTPGYETGTPWCDALQVAEDDPDGNLDANRELYQAIGTFGIHILPDTWGFNGEEAAYMLFKPHADLRQTIYPKKTGFGGTVEVTLTLRNNMRNHNGGTEQPINNLVLTYELPHDFTFINVIPPSPTPTLQTSEQLVWTDLDLPAGEGVELPIPLRFRIRAPFYESVVPGHARVSPSPPFCIPASETQYFTERGIQVNKTPVPNDPVPFGVVEYRMELYNKTSIPVDDLRITDTLPSGFTYMYVRPGDPEPISTNPLVWENLVVDPSQRLRIYFKARAPGLYGEYYNEVQGVSSAVYVTYTSGYWSNVRVSVGPGVALYKAVGPEQAEAGETVVYTLTVDNRLGEAIADVRVVDDLPSGFTYQGMIGGDPPITTTPQVVWEVDRINKNEKVDLIFRAAIDDQAPSGIFCNQASATAYEADDPEAPISIPDTDLTACVDVAGVPTVVTDKTVSPNQVRAGNFVTYTIVLDNQTEEMRTVRLTDTLPVSITYDSVVGSTPAPLQTSPLVWDGLQVGVQQTMTLLFRAWVDLYTRSGTYYNHLDGTTDAFPLLPRELAPLVVEEIPRYDLQITKSDGQVTVDEGQLLQYTVAYTNANEAGVTLTNVMITDTFSPPPPYADPIVSGDWVQVAPDMYTHLVGELGPGASGAVTFNLQLSGTIPPSVMVVSNTVEIGHDTAALAFESDPSNNSFTDIDILHGADLIVAGLEIAPANPQVGEPIVFAVTVRNQGKDPTLNPLNQGWFPVELYLKGSDFHPPGPPGDVYPPAVFDHWGGYCADHPNCTQVRPEYFTYSPGLAGDGDETTVEFTVVLDQADDYDVYVQVDPSFTGLGIEEPWGHDYGLIPEAVETNNIYSHGIARVGVATFNIYLPTVMKNY